MNETVFAAMVVLLSGTWTIGGQTLPVAAQLPSAEPAAGQIGRVVAEAGAASEGPMLSGDSAVPVSPQPNQAVPPPVGGTGPVVALPPFAAPPAPDIEPGPSPPIGAEVPPLWSGPAPPPAAAYRLWAGSEALLFWERKESLPANLVTAGLPLDAVPGALGQPNTLVLSGSGGINFSPFAGIRAFAGGWLDPQQNLGLEASGLVLEDRGRSFAFNSTLGGNPLLALRHLDPGGGEDAFVLAAPPLTDSKTGAFAGGVLIATDSQLWGADANVLHAFCFAPCYRLVGLAGFRYLDLSESLAIHANKTALDGSSVSFLGQNFAAPATERIDDQFHARSQFFGGQLGLRGDFFFSHFFVGLSGKVALGRTNEVVNALGVSSLSPGSGPSQAIAGGLYALPSNSGRSLNQDFGVVPEVQLKGGVLLTRWLRATVGYDFLYWSRVLRVGDQVDLVVDPRQVPTDPAYKAGTPATAPRPVANPTSFWVQGLTLGLECTF